MTTKKTCRWCPDPPERGGTLCKDCKEKAKRYRADLKAERTKNRECYRCGDKLTEQDLLEAYASCTTCRDKDAKRKRPGAVKADPGFTIPEIC